MKNAVGLIAALGFLVAGGDLGACGDKFLVVGRGTRFQRGEEHGGPVAVLIYAPPSSSLGDRPRVLSVEKALARAGYRPTLAATSEDLSGLLRSAGPAVVLADIADARAVERQMAGGASASVVLPILSDVTHGAIAAARKAWGGAVNVSASPESVLYAVDDAVDRLARKKIGSKL